VNILLLGATGRVGQVLLKKMLQDGHQVVALVRSPDKITIESPQLHLMHGDVLDVASLEKALTEMPITAVVSALNTDKNNTLSRSTPALIHLMEQQHIKRLITIGTAGILDSRTEPGVYRFQSSESKRRTTTAAEDHLAAYQLLAASDLAWTVVCPTYLPDGAETGKYRVEADRLPVDGKEISVADTAVFAYEQLTSSAYIGKRVGIAY